MNKTGNAADRVRPILQAMEKSIDSARQRRTQAPGSYPRPVSSAPPVMVARVSADLHPQPQPSLRLKARPKRTA